MSVVNKSFKTIKEQIDLLKSRNLSVKNEEAAKAFLLNNNYYRISGYSLTLRENDDFKNIYDFQDIVDIYKCDWEMRYCILKYLEIIEVRIKSLYAYEFAQLYDAYDYKNGRYFDDEQKHQEIIEKADIQKEKRLQHEAYLKHYVNDLQSEIPIWAYVDLFTISDISFLYSISRSELKKKISSYYGLNHTRKDLLSAYLKSMTIIRNICAHGGRLYNRLFEQKPSLSKNEKQLLIKGDNNNIDNAHLYGYILIMRRLLLTEEFAALKKGIIKISSDYSFVDMKYYGFRNDWTEKL